MIRLVQQAGDQPVHHSPVSSLVRRYLRRIVQGLKQGEKGIQDRLPDDLVAEAALVDDNVEELHGQAHGVVTQVLVVPRTSNTAASE